jgi:hypothetical protein
MEIPQAARARGKVENADAIFCRAAGVHSYAQAQTAIAVFALVESKWVG